jgi:hypothetical protein
MSPQHQSLGSLGDSLGMSVMSVYAFSVIQLPVMFVVTLNSPTVRVDLFTASARQVFFSFFFLVCVFQCQTNQCIKKAG